MLAMLEAELAQLKADLAAYKRGETGITLSDQELEALYARISGLTRIIAEAQAKVATKH